MSSSCIVSTNVNRIEGNDKAMGSALYGADLRREGLLCMSAVYSSFPSARILAIDYNGADKMPGVLGIYGFEDVPGAKTFGILCPDQFVYACDKVYNTSDVICCVAAESQREADAAAAVIKVTYEELTPVVDMDLSVGSADVRGDFYPGNVVDSLNAETGDADAALSEADIVLEADYKSNYIEHAYIEPEAVMTELAEDGSIIIRGSIQLPFYLKDAAAACLGLPMNQVSVRRSVIGGSFGGKAETVHAMAIRAGIVTLKTGRPVRYVLTRENSFAESHKRHPWKTHFKLGADKEGNLKAIVGDAVTDSGPYMMMTPCVAWKGNVTGFGCYRLENGRYQTKAVLTNNINTSSMRGFGTPQALFAVEGMMNELARTLGMSPYKLRRQNALTQGELTGHGQKLDGHTVSLIEVLDKVAEATDFERKYWEYEKAVQGAMASDGVTASKRARGRFRKGIGIALSMRGCSSGAEANDIARARVDIDKDGTAKVTIGLAEMGQGLRTVMTQMTAEALGLPIDKVRMNMPDTQLEMDTGAAVGSRATMLGGLAILNAVDNLKKVFAECYEYLSEDGVFEKYAVKAGEGKNSGSEYISPGKVSPEEICFNNGIVYFGKHIAVPFPEAVAMCYGNGFTLSCAGTHRVKGLKWNKAIEYGDAFLSYTYSAQAAEVELDTYTGAVKVTNMTACHDIGKAINPDMAEGQIHGGMVMSLGNALLEEFKIRDGVPVTKDYTTYLIPTTMDMPDMKVIIVENYDPNGPFGAKSLGEAAVELGVASISAAVNQAMGCSVPLREVPMTPERVLNHMEKYGK